MPISQATILAIYGDLVDLVEKIETLNNQASQPGLFAAGEDRQPSLEAGVAALFASAKEAQVTAIAHIMADDPKIEVNPVTGRLDE